MDEPVANWTVAIDADTSSLKTELARSADLGRQFGTVLGRAFEGVALQGRGLGDVLRSLGLSLSQMALRSAFKPLEQVFSNVFSGIGTSAPLASPFTLAAGTPVPFAKGGIISTPTTFPLGAGTGLAGERGAEAILPLARGADGRLGVAAAGGGGVSVTFNVTTPDADSFRRSESQIAAMLARSVGAGQRNL